MRIEAEGSFQQYQAGAHVSILGKRLGFGVGSIREEVGITVEGNGGTIAYGHIIAAPISPKSLPERRLNGSGSSIGNITHLGRGVGSRIELKSGSGSAKPTMLVTNSEPFGRGSQFQARVSGSLAVIDAIAPTGAKIHIEDRNTGKLIVNLPH